MDVSDISRINNAYMREQEKVIMNFIVKISISLR